MIPTTTAHNDQRLQIGLEIELATPMLLAKRKFFLKILNREQE